MSTKAASSLQVLVVLGALAITTVALRSKPTSLTSSDLPGNVHSVARSLSGTGSCDPSGWCVEYSVVTASLDSDASTPDVSLVYHASEPHQDGTYTKFYKVQLMDETCQTVVSDEAVTPHDPQGIVPHASYDASGLLTAGLDIDVDTIHSSSFTTQLPDFMLSIKFCVSMELLTSFDCLGVGDCTASGASAVASSKTIVALSLDTRPEVGFQITDFSAAPDKAECRGRSCASNGRGKARGINAQGEPIDDPLTAFGLYDKIQEALNNGYKVKVFYRGQEGFPWRIRIQTGHPPNRENMIIINLDGFGQRGASQKDEYQTSRDLWNSQQSSSYDYTYTDQGSSPVTVMVRNAAVTQAIDGNGNQLDFSIVTKPPTIDEYFDAISQEINGKGRYMKNEYDSAKGHPTSIDMVTDSGRMKRSITNFQDSNLSRLLQDDGDLTDITTDQSVESNNLNSSQTLFEESSIANYEYTMTEECSTCDPADYPHTIIVDEGYDLGDYDVVVNYPLETFFCDDNNQETENVQLKPGQRVQFCVHSPSNEARVAILHSVRFENEQDSGLTIPIIDETGVGVAGQPSTMTCEAGICRVTSIAYGRLYQTLVDGILTSINGGAKVVGTCVLDFTTDSGRRHLVEVGMDTSSRRLQKGGRTDFGLVVQLAPPPGSSSPPTTSLSLVSIIAVSTIGYLLA